jgi:hypothetical protein
MKTCWIRKGRRNMKRRIEDGDVEKEEMGKKEE